MKIVMRFLIVIALALTGNQVWAASCPDSGLLGTRLFDKMCWDCLFPMQISGAKVNAPSGDGSDGRPDGSLSSYFCSCPGPLGIPEFGVPFGAWMPKFVTETVQVPYCSPGLAGVSLGGRTRVSTGGDIRPSNTMQRKKQPDSAFLHFHTFSFPILAMLELFMEGGCDAEGYVDIELQYISEPDPLWSDSLMASLLTPEAMLFTNPAAQLVCVADCNAVSTGSDGVSIAHWCAGCWGNTYPFTGSAWHAGDRVKHSSLVATKALSALHRRLLAYKSYGSGPACGDRVLAPTLLKEQYRFGMFYPGAEASKNHRIGETTITWGANKLRSDAGSNHVYIGYRYQDCCMR